MPVPPGTKVLVLNDDYTPLNAVHWKKAMKRLFESPCERCKESGRVYIRDRNVVETCNHCHGTGLLPPANVVEYFENMYVVRDGRGNEHLVPAVIANAHHVKRKFRRVPYSKPNVLKRDGFRCQFCGKQFSPQDLTLDHVVPRSVWKSGTPTHWNNIVAACRPCNLRKANRTPEQAGMPLKKLVRGRWVNYKKPKAPTTEEIALGLAYRNIPEEWETYVAHLRKSFPKS